MTRLNLLLSAAIVAVAAAAAIAAPSADSKDPKVATPVAGDAKAEPKASAVSTAPAADEDNEDEGED